MPTWPATPALILWIADYDDRGIRLALARDGSGNIAIVARQADGDGYAVYRPDLGARLLWHWKRLLFERCVTRAWTGPLLPDQIPSAQPPAERPRLARLYRALPSLGPAPLGRRVARNAVMGVERSVLAGGRGIAARLGDAIY